MQKLHKLWQQYRAWSMDNRHKELKEMSNGYLFFQLLMTSFITTMLPTLLLPATKLYLESLEKSFPWWWVLVGLYLLVWWSVQIMALLVVASHSRALSEKIFAFEKAVDHFRLSSKRNMRIPARRSISNG